MTEIPLTSEAETAAGDTSSSGLIAPRIHVRLDDRALTLPAGATLADLLVQEQREAGAVATALNGGFVPRGARSATALSDGDQVLFFQPIVGG